MPDNTDATTPPPARPVTSASLRGERLRQRMAQAMGARRDGADPGLSPAPTPRDPELTNRLAVAALVVGIVGVFFSTFFALPVVAIGLALLGFRRAQALAARGKAAWGRRRCLWAIWLGVFGIAQAAFGLFVAPLLPR